MRKKTGFIVILMILITLSNFLFGWPVVYLYNNFLATKFLNSLEKTIPTYNSKIVTSHKRFGILNGNSNHCDCEATAGWRPR